jgi:hypothetical protein
VQQWRKVKSQSNAKVARIAIIEKIKCYAAAIAKINFVSTV